MEYIINDKKYVVEIKRKKTNKGTYIRIKDNNIIYVTTNILMPDFYIKKLIKNNEKSIMRMINQKQKENLNTNQFYYLGKSYEIVNTSNKKIEFIDNKVFIGNVDVDSFYKKEASKLFQERLDYWYNSFTKKIPKPKLVIRKMKTRWGVCNTKDIKITLNLELMKKSIDCLDYVINHELSHLIHPNHSKEFWSLVEENYPNYKEIRKKMKFHEE